MCVINSLARICLLSGSSDEAGTVFMSAHTLEKTKSSVPANKKSCLIFFKISNTRVDY